MNFISSKLLVRATVLALAAAALAACSGAEQRVQQHLEKGRDFVAAGNFEKARLEFKNALQIEPDTVEAIFMMGRTMEGLQSFRDAAASYRRVMELDPSHVEARVRLGHLYMLAGAPQEEVRKLVEEGLAQTPEHAGLLVLRGGLRVRGKDLAGALEDGETAWRIDPANTEAVALLSSIYRVQGRIDQAVVTLEEGIRRNPDYAPMRVVLASIFAEGKNHAGAERLLKEVIELEPDVFTHRTRLAGFYAELGRGDEAERVLRDAVAHAPDGIAQKLALTEFLLRGKGVEQAEEALRGFIAAAPEQFVLRSALAALYESSGRPEQAQQAYRELIAADKDGAEGMQARSRLAALLWRSGQKDAAEQEIAAVLAKNPRDNDALLLRAELALQQNATADAIAALRTVLRDQPESLPALRLLARAHVMNEEPHLARDQLQQVVQLAPGDRASRLQLAQVLAQVGDTDTAEKHLQTLIKTDHKDADALEVLFKVNMARKDIDAAQATAQSVLDTYPDRALGHYLLGEALRARKDHKGAIKQYEAALSRSAPDATLPLTTLVSALLEQGQAEQAMRHVERALEASPQSAMAHHLKGEVLLFGLKRHEDSIASFERTLELQPGHAVAYRNLAFAHLAGGNQESALDSYRRGLQATNGNPLLAAQLSALYERFGRHDEAIGVYEQLHRQLPESASVINNLAMLLANYRSDSASLEQAEQLATRLSGSDNPGHLDTRGWVSYRRGDLDTATLLLQQAENRMPDNAVVLYHLGKVYHDSGNARLAREKFERALAGEQPFVGRDDARALLDALKQAG